MDAVVLVVVGVVVVAVLVATQAAALKGRIWGTQPAKEIVTVSVGWLTVAVTTVSHAVLVTTVSKPIGGRNSMMRPGFIEKHEPRYYLQPKRSI